jgi:hypothetical protein
MNLPQAMDFEAPAFMLCFYCTTERVAGKLTESYSGVNNTAGKIKLLYNCVMEKRKCDDFLERNKPGG